MSTLRPAFRYIGINDTWLMLLGIPVLSFLVPMVLFGLDIEEGWQCIRSSLFVGVLNTALFWIGDRQITVAFRKKFPMPSQSKQRLTRSLSVIFLYTIALALLMDYFRGFAPPDPGNPFIDASPAKVIGGCLFATATIVSIYEAIFFMRQWMDSAAHAEKLKKETTVAQLEALKNQTNPHFLFNSLNTLSTLIPEDPPAAVEFVQRLSKVYRAILDLHDKQVVTLGEELSCLDHYIYLVHARFGDNLRLTIDASDDARNKYMVPLSVQILVENAIKHNIVASKKPLLISIRATAEWLEVRNNLQLRSGTEPGTGTGLRNINDRFLLTFHTGIQVEESSDSFTVRLPLVTIADL